jgi:hypothetical protein
MVSVDTSHQATISRFQNYCRLGGKILTVSNSKIRHRVKLPGHIIPSPSGVDSEIDCVVGFYFFVIDHNCQLEGFPPSLTTHLI